MVALYNATDGANWTDNTNWLSNETLSEWHGVTTDATGRVTVLSLSVNELSGRIPAELGNLANLQRLDLTDNYLIGEIPAELGNLANLQRLVFYNNDLILSGEIPAELGNLANLQTLVFSSNALSGEIPAELGNLANLQRLSIYANALSGEIPAELGNLANLQTLSIYVNDLSGEIPAELGNLANLQTLYLYANDLSGEIPAELGNLANLQTLSLSWNALSGEIPMELGNLANLQRLYLYANDLSGEIPAELGSLTNLQWLILHGNQLSGEIPVELGGLTNLLWLQLQNNQLSGEIPVELGNLANLQRLYLYANDLSGEIPVELGNLANLRVLNLFDNTLSGPLPQSLSMLSQLSVLDIRLTTLCAVRDTAFLAWLATINFQGAVCAPPRPPGGGGGGGPSTSPPGAPRNLTAMVGDGEVLLSWDAPESDGGAEITDYEYRINGTNPWISTGSTETTYTVTGLDNGTAYVFEVRAVNRIGTSRVPNQAEATPEEPRTVLLAHFANGNNTVFNSRVYLFNPSVKTGRVTVRVFTLPLMGGLAQELTTTPLELGSLGPKSGLNIKLVEDILTPLGITTPYTIDGGNLTLELTILAAAVRGTAQVFSSGFGFGTYPLQEIPSTSAESPTVLVANFTNGNNGALNSRVYLWNPSATDGRVTVRVFTLPNTGDSMRLQTVPLGILKAFSARNIRIAEDILAFFGDSTALYRRRWQPHAGIYD